MSLFTRWSKKQKNKFATATVAIPATVQPDPCPSVATIARIAVADHEKGSLVPLLRGEKIQKSEPPKPENIKKDNGPSVATVASVAVADHENGVPALVWVALDAGGIQPDELPDWSPGSCQSLLLDVKELYPDRFTLRGGLGYHGVNCPDEWPPEFSMAIQSVYIQSMQCSEKDWRIFLDLFDGKKET